MRPLPPAHPPFPPESVATAAPASAATQNLVCVRPSGSSVDSIEMPPNAGGGGRTSGTSRMRGRSNTGSASSSTTTGGMNEERGKARILAGAFGRRPGIVPAAARLAIPCARAGSGSMVIASCPQVETGRRCCRLRHHRRLRRFELQLQRGISRRSRPPAPIVIDSGGHFAAPRIRVGRFAGLRTIAALFRCVCSEVRRLNSACTLLMRCRQRIAIGLSACGRFGIIRHKSSTAVDWFFFQAGGKLLLADIECFRINQRRGRRRRGVRYRLESGFHGRSEISGNVGRSPARLRDRDSLPTLPVRPSPC